MSVARRACVVATFVLPLSLVAQTATKGSAVPTVGPLRGTVIVVGGGTMGPEVYSRFIGGKPR